MPPQNADTQTHELIKTIVLKPLNLAIVVCATIDNRHRNRLQQHHYFVLFFPFSALRVDAICGAAAAILQPGGKDRQNHGMIGFDITVLPKSKNSSSVLNFL